jgi:hypothetical protein
MGQDLEAVHDGDVGDALLAEPMTDVEADAAIAVAEHVLLQGPPGEVAIQDLGPMANEDDVVEVRLLVDWAWAHLPAGARGLLAVLASCEGDDMDARSLAQIARVGSGARAALARLERFRLVQQPLAGRYTVHAVVRQAVARRAPVPRERYFRHYVALLEQHPERVDLEQTHLYAAMDHAHATSDLDAALRLERLLARLGG